ANLAPGPLQQLIPFKVSRVESLRPGMAEKGSDYDVTRWIETVETELPADEMVDDGRGVLFSNDSVRYLASWPPASLIKRVFAAMAEEAEIATLDLPRDLRVRQLGHVHFAFNYGTGDCDITDHLDGGELILGEALIPPAGVAAWRGA
ncbi:MAG: beta-galactosidase, partial [Pseudomonadota bacterium]